MPDESPSLAHNRKLLTAYMATSKVYSRYPKVSEQLPCLPLDTAKLPPFSYNPSIIKTYDQTWLTYRYHFAGDARTKLSLSILCAEDGFTGTVIGTPRDLPLTGNSLEDARLFSLHGENWMSWVESNFIGQANPKCVVKYAQLEPGLKINRIFQIKAGSNDGLAIEKNWVFFASDDNLFCLWKSDQIIWHIHGDTVVGEESAPGPRWPYGEPRGDCIIPYDGKLIRFFHSSLRNEIGPVPHRYYVGACLMEARPPFKVLAVSKKPILYGSEVDNLKRSERPFHWKANVIFPGGAVQDGDGWILAVGVNDAACALVKVKPENLNL